MGIRETALCAVVVFLSLRALKDWFQSLCCLILMMAIIHHDRMPTNMFGVQGLNPWNCLLVGTFIGWLIKRHGHGSRRDMPSHILTLLLLYLGVVLIGCLRAAIDPGHFRGYPLRSLISEEMINTIKWVFPGLLLFDGCRTRRQVLIAIVCIFAVYFLISVQLIRHMPVRSAFLGILSVERRTRMCSRVGYGPCDMSTILAGATWGGLAMLSLVRRKKKYCILILGAVAIIMFAQSLTGGRAGYLAWGATGLTFCLLKWRKYLILAPVIALLLPTMFPGVVKRMLTGIEVDAAGQQSIEENTLTSDRMMFWPYVIDEIRESPWIGHGRRAMQRIGLAEQLEIIQPGTGAPHPHNMYLETLLDNGIIGSVPIFFFWGIMLVYSAGLFRSRDSVCAAVGGLALALMLSQLFAGIGSQHFYPEESTTCMWAAIFLALRVHVEKKRVQMETVVTDDPRIAYVHQPLTATAYNYAYE